MIKIDKNIPMPNKHKRGESKYPFRQMKIGDSFLFTDGFKKDQRKAQLRISAIGNVYGKTTKPRKRFATRKEKNGIRIWRIE